MDKKNYDYLLKILVIGELNAGKSNLILRFSLDIYKDNIIIGNDFEIKTVKIDDKIIRVRIFDPCRPNDPSQRFFKLLTKYDYKGTHGIVITYDITDRYKFIKAREWIENTMELAPLDTRNAKIILVGNKCDLSNEREVNEEDGKKLAEEFGLLFFETSAKTGYNVNLAFESLIENIIKHSEKLEERKITLKKDNKNKNIKNKNNKCSK